MMRDAVRIDSMRSGRGLAQARRSGKGRMSLTALLQTRQSKKTTPFLTVIPPAAVPPGTRFPCALNATAGTAPAAAPALGVADLDLGTSDAAPSARREADEGSCERSRHRVLHRAQMERERRVSWWAWMVRVVARSMSMASRVMVARVSMAGMVVGRGGRGGEGGARREQKQNKTSLAVMHLKHEHGADCFRAREYIAPAGKSGRRSAAT